MSREGQFAGAVAVVTGGTQGVGEAVARLFAERGAAGLAICGRQAAKGEALAAELTAAGCPTEFVAADLADVDQAVAVVDRAERRFGRLDSLVNCAGATDRGTVDDTSVEVWDRLFAINARAPFFLMQRAMPLLRRSGRGTVVNIISIAAHGGLPMISAYVGSKAALAALTRNIANAVKRDRVRVNGLNIGWTDTPNETAIQTGYHGRPADWVGRVEAEQPFGRLLKPADVARAVAFLASDESGIMTGAVVDFDQQVIGTYEYNA